MPLNNVTETLLYLKDGFWLLKFCYDHTLLVQQEQRYK